MFLEGVSIKKKSSLTLLYGIPRFDFQPHPRAWTLRPKFMECKQTLQGTHHPSMNAFWWVVAEIYPSEKHCGKFHKCDGRTYRWMNIRTERQKQYSPWHHIKSNDSNKPHPGYLPSVVSSTIIEYGTLSELYSQSKNVSSEEQIRRVFENNWRIIFVSSP